MDIRDFQDEVLESSWGLFVDVDEFVASHSDWVVFSATGWFENPGLTRPAPSTNARMLDNVAAFGGFEKLMGFVASFSSWGDASCVPLGFHFGSSSDNLWGPVTMIFASPYASNGVRMQLEPFCSDDVPAWPFKFRFIATVSNPVVPICRDWYKHPVWPDMLPNPLPLDNDMGHGWLHGALIVCDVFTFVNENPVLFCRESDPTFLSHLVAHFLLWEVTVADMVARLRVSSDVLSSALNMYRLTASALLPTVDASSFRDSLEVVCSDALLVDAFGVA